MTSARWILVGLSLVACGGRYVTDGSAAQGGGASAGGSTAAADPNAACLNSGEPQPPSPLTFLFESHQALWLRPSCDVEYTVAKVCKDVAVPFTTKSACGQECDSANHGCADCGACTPRLLQVGQFRPGGPNVSTNWDGYVYPADASGKGCTCSQRMPATAGAYTITVAAFYSSGDAWASNAPFMFTTRFEYPSPDGFVHVPLEVTAR